MTGRPSDPRTPGCRQILARSRFPQYETCRLMWILRYVVHHTCAGGRLYSTGTVTVIVTLLIKTQGQIQNFPAAEWGGGRALKLLTLVHQSCTCALHGGAERSYHWGVRGHALPEKLAIIKKKVFRPFWWHLNIWDFISILSKNKISQANTELIGQLVHILFVTCTSAFTECISQDHFVVILQSELAHQKIRFQAKCLPRTVQVKKFPGASWKN